MGRRRNRAIRLCESNKSLSKDSRSSGTAITDCWKRAYVTTAYL